MPNSKQDIEKKFDDQMGVLIAKQLGSVAKTEDCFICGAPFDREKFAGDIKQFIHESIEGVLKEVLPKAGDTTMIQNDLKGFVMHRHNIFVMETMEKANQLGYLLNNE